MRPQRVVDLGVHWGCSTFAFAQGVKDAGLDCEVIGVDTFRGDEHAGEYGEEVFEFVNACAERHYSGIPFDIRRSTFEECAEEIERDSVDLIHFDGLHTYDAVSDDFRLWLDRLRPDGVMLFHDTCPRIPYGTIRFWSERRAEFPSWNFPHSWGLGVLFPKGDQLYREMIREGFPERIARYRAEDGLRHLRLGTARRGSWTQTERRRERELQRAVRDGDLLPEERVRYPLRARAVRRMLHESGVGPPATAVVVGADCDRQTWEIRRLWPDAHIAAQREWTAAPHSTTPAAAPPCEYDLVLAMAAFEDVDDIDSAFDKAALLVRPGGHLLITSPDPRWLRRHARRSGASAPRSACMPEILRASRSAGFDVVRQTRAMSVVAAEVGRRGWIRSATALARLDGAIERTPGAGGLLFNRLLLAARSDRATSADDAAARASRTSPT